MNTAKTFTRASAAMLAAWLTTACSGVLTSDEPAKRFYLLQPVGGAAGAAMIDPAGPDAGVIVDPVPGLDTDRLLALGSDARLIAYGNARWPEHLPELLGSVLARSLEGSGGYRSVTAGAVLREPGWTLRLELREFYGVQDAAGETRAVRVSLAGTIACGGGIHPLHAETETPVNSERLESIVRAHQAGLDAATRQLADGMTAACPGRGED